MDEHTITPETRGKETLASEGMMVYDVPFNNSLLI